jgi:hypothetical protein
VGTSDGLYPGALPDCERMVAAMNFDNLVAVLAVAAAVAPRYWTW